MTGSGRSGLFNQGKQADFDLEQDAVRLYAKQSMVRQDSAADVHGDSRRGRVFQRQHHAGGARNPVQVSPASLRIPGPVFSAMLNARGASGHPLRWVRRPAAPALESRWEAWRRPMPNSDSRAAPADAEVKKAYRKLVSQFHPDKLVSHGLPEEMMEIAKTRVREINTAYDQIKQTRGFK